MLDKLFFTLCPENTEMSDILLKVAALNDFCSTNIFSVYPVAKHILSLDIDSKLKAGDVSLVSEVVSRGMWRRCAYCPSLPKLRIISA